VRVVVVRLSQIRAVHIIQGGGEDGQFAGGGGCGGLEGGYGSVSGASESAEGAFIVIGSAFPLEGA
jgi:hypothetical protein